MEFIPAGLLGSIFMCGWFCGCWPGCGGKAEGLMPSMLPPAMLCMPGVRIMSGRTFMAGWEDARALLSANGKLCARMGTRLA